MDWGWMGWSEAISPPVLVLGALVLVLGWLVRGGSSDEF